MATLVFVLFLTLTILVASESSCQHEKSPLISTCTGCPPRDQQTGKLCASTTRYNDMTKGACGCGSEPNPKSYWSKSMYTAALNCKNLDPQNPTLSWCPKNCGGCFRLCSTGGTTSGKPTERGKCIVVKVENRCGDGYKAPHEAQWCRQELSFNECVANPAKCNERGSTNDYGYSAHFDLQDANLQVTNVLGWDNTEVTFEPVDCGVSPVPFPNWGQNCQCAAGNSGPSVPPSPPQQIPPPPPRQNPPPPPPRQNPPPPPRQNPPPPPSGSSCASYAGNADNEYWIELNVPGGGNGVSVNCANNRVIQCEEKWGRFICDPQGQCTFPRSVNVGGRTCSIRSPNRAVAGASSEFSQQDSASSLSSGVIGIIVAGVVVVVLMIVGAIGLALKPKKVETA